MLNQPILKEIQNSQKFAGFVVLERAALNDKTAGGQYLSASIADKSVSMDAKMWDACPFWDDLNDNVGKIVYITGVGNEFKGQVQMKITSIRALRADDKVDIEDFMQFDGIDVEDTLARIKKLLESLADDDYRCVSLAFFEKYEQALRIYPGGQKVHHSKCAGLLRHTYQMMCCIKGLSTIYSKTCNQDLCVCGAFLHDLGKISEFDLSVFGTVNDYTAEGRLLGHLVIGAMEVRETCKNLGVDANKALLLEHMLLSHHGDVERGSATVPKFAEAFLLAEVDLIDSRMDLFAQEYETLTCGESSKKGNFYMDGIRVFKPFA